jgi:N utilization substance protein B
MTRRLFKEQGRRKARERALQILFQVDMGGTDPQEAMKNMDESFGPVDNNVDFINRIVMGTLDNLEFINQTITSVSQDWDLKRMAGADRNIIRIAFYEIFFCRDTPNNVAVNEAIELGKTYGGEDSARFINGILGKVLAKPEDYFPKTGDAKSTCDQRNTTASPGITT